MIPLLALSALATGACLSDPGLNSLLQSHFRKPCDYLTREEVARVQTLAIPADIPVVFRPEDVAHLPGLRSIVTYENARVRFNKGAFANHPVRVGVDLLPGVEVSCEGPGSFPRDVSFLDLNSTHLRALDSCLPGVRAESLQVRQLQRPGARVDFSRFAAGSLLWSVGPVPSGLTVALHPATLQFTLKGAVAPQEPTRLDSLRIEGKSCADVSLEGVAVSRIGLQSRRLDRLKLIDSRIRSISSDAGGLRVKAIEIHDEGADPIDLGWAARLDPEELDASTAGNLSVPALRSLRRLDARNLILGSGSRGICAQFPAMTEFRSDPAPEFLDFSDCGAQDLEVLIYGRKAGGARSKVRFPSKANGIRVADIHRVAVEGRLGLTQGTVQGLECAGDCVAVLPHASAVYDLSEIRGPMRFEVPEGCKTRELRLRKFDPRIDIGAFSRCLTPALRELNLVQVPLTPSFFDSLTPQSWPQLESLSIEGAPGLHRFDLRLLPDGIQRVMLTRTGLRELIPAGGRDFPSLTGLFLGANPGLPRTFALGIRASALQVYVDSDRDQKALRKANPGVHFMQYLR